MSQLELDNDLEEILPTDQQEDESDIQGKIDFKSSVVTTADWTVETLNNQISKGTIDLDPGFQRRAAWDAPRKSRLIESLIVGLPIPNIVLAENPSQKGRFIVIDGKQRLLTIQEFHSNNMALESLDIRKDLEGITFSKLPQDDREGLENTTIRATVIKNIQSPDFLYVMFYRLNSGSLQLSPQELRRALIGGNALDEIDHFIQNSGSFGEIFSSKLDRRMRDSELVLRYLAFESDLKHYDGNLKKTLDQTLKHFEDNWSKTQSELHSMLSTFEFALKTSKEVFGDKVFRKWIGNRYEPRINRAIFDVLVRFFSDPQIASQSVSNKDTVERAFQNLCSNPEFKSAIESTTKSIGATQTRMALWGGTLADLLNKKFDPDSLRIS